MPDEIKLGWNDLGDGTYLRVSQELLDDINLGKFKGKPGESPICMNCKHAVKELHGVQIGNGGSGDGPRYICSFHTKVQAPWKWMRKRDRKPITMVITKAGDTCEAQDMREKL